MKYIIRRLSVLFIILSMVISFAGCGSSDDNEPFLENGLVSPEKNSNEYNFVFVCPFTNSEYWQQCIDGINRADSELGSTTKVLGSDSIDNFSVEIVDNFKKAIDLKPNGIFAYASVADMQPYIEQATDMGIPVITIDADATTDKRLAFVGSGLYRMGYSGGETMLEYVDGGSKVGCIVSTKDLENEETVMSGFNDAITDRNITVVATEEGNNDPATAKQAAAKLLSEHPDITGIFCTGGYNVTGAGQYLEEIGREDIALIGFEDVEENLKLLRSGAINALIAQNPYEMGYIASYLMNEYLNNGALTSKSYITQSVLITSDNVDTYKADNYTPDINIAEHTIGFFDHDSSFYFEYEDGRRAGFAYEYMQSIATIAGWKYNYVYGTYDELLEKLESGEVDMIVGSLKSANSDSRVKLSANDMGMPSVKRYIAVSANKHALLNELNGAMLTLENEESTYINEIYEKYYEYKGSNYALTESERNYLSDQTQIRFGYLTDNLPFSDRDSNGEPSGLVKDLMKYISNYTQVPIKPIAYDSIESVTKALQNHEIDVAFPGYSDIWRNEENGLKQTDSIVSDRVMMVYSGDYSDELLDRIAIHKSGIGQENFVMNNYPDATIKTYGNRKQVFEAIETGREQCTIGYSSIIQRFLYQNPSYSNLHIAYLDASFDLGIIGNEEHSYLISILNKAMKNMGSSAINSAVVSYAGVEKNPTVTDFIRSNSLLFVVFFSLVILAIGSLFALNVWQSHKFKVHQQQITSELEDALADAKKANQAKTNFLSSMSHDIRTPMNAIMGMTTIALNKESTGEDVHEYLEKIGSSGRTLLALINDVLDISKIESGVAELNPMVFSLKDSIDSLEHVFKQTARDKSLNLEMITDCEPGLLIYADRVRFEQVIVNLTSNAIKYTPSGGRVVMKVKAKDSEAENMTHITFTVEDNGIGMSKEFVSVMYDTFTRAKDTRINAIQGTGLGLSIVKEVVDMMGGTIDCESEEGVGTKFTVNFDVQTAHEESRELTEINEVDDEGEVSSIHLLIAEDNNLNWEVASELLSMHEITCERAENGQICLDMLLASEPGTYSLVLMDIQMPVLNGREATEKIRACTREDIRSIPILAMTADAFAEDIKACMDIGMNGHIAKPINIDKLLQEINKILKGKSASQE